MNFIDQHRDTYGVEPMQGAADRPVRLSKAGSDAAHLSTAMPVLVHIQTDKEVDTLIHGSFPYIGFIKQAEAGLPIKELCRKGGFSVSVASRPSGNTEPT